MKFVLVPDLHGDLARFRAICAHFEKNVDRYTKIVFLGDYVDSHDASDEDILTLVDELIMFAEKHPLKVRLLLGNHDYQYHTRRNICSGYRSSIAQELHEKFAAKRHLFSVSSYMYNSETNKEYLFSHAGFVRTWYEDEAGLSDKKIAKLSNIVNSMLYYKGDAYFDKLWTVHRNSGGYHITACPLWARPDIYTENIPSAIQYVGHTHSKEPYKTEALNGGSITTIDTGKEYELDLETNTLLEIAYE